MEQKKKRKLIPHIVIIMAYLGFLGISFFTGFEPGKQIGLNFFTFALTMLKIVPFTFMLIGLFEVWVKREIVEKHLGEESGLKGYLWAIVLAGTIIGPLYVALPIAHSLHKKGAKFGVIFTYIAATAICRVPMTTFEASFLGIKFTAIRFIVSLPLVVLTSMMFGKYLTKIRYTMQEKV